MSVSKICQYFFLDLTLFNTFAPSERPSHDSPIKKNSSLNSKV